MTQYELQVMNYLLGGESVTFISSLSDVHLSLPQYQLTVDTMIQSGLLIDRNTFSDKGALLTKRLMDYKNAKKYVSINNFYFALLDDETAIMVFEAPSGAYILERLKAGNLVPGILQFYPAYSKYANSTTSGKKSISKFNLDVQYPMRTSVLSVKTSTNGQKLEDEEFFTHEEQIYHYKSNHDLLLTLSFVDFQDELTKRLSI